MARRVENQIPLGNYAYLFTSMNQNIEDYAVLAHGAQVAGRVFYPPQNCTINYYGSPGSPYQAKNGPVAQYEVFRRRGQTPFSTVRHGYQANDVVLGKILGRHWVDLEESGGNHPYFMVRQEMVAGGLADDGSWLPHLVVIRNRKWPHMKSEVWLSALTKEIIKVRRGPVHIHVFACLDLEQQNRWRSGKQAFQTPTEPPL